jgi:hypothetical protein
MVRSIVAALSGFLIVATIVYTMGQSDQSVPRDILASYPPPESTPSPTPTPDAGGRLGPPVGIVSSTTTITDSGYSDQLQPIADALASADAFSLAHFMTPTIEIVDLDSRFGGTVLDFVGARDAISGFFAALSVPVLEGFVELETGCIRLFSSGWIGAVPTGKSGISAHPVLQDIYGTGAAWDVCEGFPSNDPEVRAWYVHHYHGLVENAVVTYGGEFYVLDP